MQSIKSISVPEPCHQSWQAMAPVEQGRHCLLCSKTVVDFSAMTDAGVISYLSASGKTCGRFEETQLTRINYLITEKPRKVSFGKGLFAAASLVILSATGKAGATPIVKTGWPPSPLRPIVEVVNAGAVGVFTVKGTVTAKDDDKPLAGVSIAVKGTNTGTQTAADGSFTLNSLSVKDTLLVSHIGYKTLEIPVSPAAKGINISLQTETAALNEVMINSHTVTRRTDITGDVAVICNCKKAFFPRLWDKVKRIF